MYGHSLALRDAVPFWQWFGVGVAVGEALADVLVVLDVFTGNVGLVAKILLLDLHVRDLVGEVLCLDRDGRQKVCECTTRRDRQLLLHVPRRVTAEQSRSEEHTSDLQSLMRISYAFFCLKK